MQRISFRLGRAVFYPFSSAEERNETLKDCAVNHYGFYSSLCYSKTNRFQTCKLNHELDSRVLIRLTARNVFRLYINDVIIMHGPARTAHGYCRVDEIDITDNLVNGINHIAVEIMTYGREWEGYDAFSNDCTFEDGLFVAEIECGGKILSATGSDEWKVCHLKERMPASERISHSRECIEVYRLDDTYCAWRRGEGDFLQTALLHNEPDYLIHESLHSVLTDHVFTDLIGVDACKIDDEKKVCLLRYETRPYYDKLFEHPPADCRKTVENLNGCVIVRPSENGLLLSPDDTDEFYTSWEGKQNYVGFVSISVTCEKKGIIDVMCSEVIAPGGSMHHGYNHLLRLHVQPGTTNFIAMEPMVARYITVYFRDVGNVTLHKLSILDDSYPDEVRATFLCSNDHVNRLYEAAKKTLLLSTKDIFMDCPGRERGGWLCDSLWMGRAAALLLVDHRIEKEFLENFLLTSPDEMFCAFFPEVYPAYKKPELYKTQSGITTWSFWLVLETCEYIQRTGDISFRDQYKPRIEAFIQGTCDFVGGSGLLENMPSIFVDWSVANLPEHISPISTAANALYAYMLIEAGQTFDEANWIAQGESVRSILRAAILGNRDAETLEYIPDSFVIKESGGLVSRGKFSEAGMYTTLWTGLFTPEETPVLFRNIRDRMGPAPVHPKDPMVGNSQLFVGLCIRLDLLCRIGAYDKMFEDMLAIYMPQLREGPGTLWESEKVDNNSRCHGFTSHVGVHFIRDVLGIGFCVSNEEGIGKRTVEIAPHICGLRWARGTRATREGTISADWRYDGNSFYMRVVIPDTYSYNIKLPREIRCLNPENVSVIVKQYRTTDFI